MPTVPTSFVPQVAPQGGGDIGQFQAPGIAAAENLAGPQVARFGQAMVGAGNQAFRLGSAIQDGIDEAATKEADVAAGRAMQQVADKYLATVGKTAETSFEAAQAELAQAAAGAADMLQNDTQRRMLGPILARNMGVFQSRMGQHRVQQVKVYQTNESVARAELSADYAIQAYAQRGEKDAEGRPVGLIRYAANADTAVAEIRKAGELMGYAPDSAQMKQLEQKVYDRMAVGIVNSMMVQKEYGQADDFLSDPGTAETLDAKTLGALRESVTANQQKSVVGELASSIMETGLLMAKSDPKTYWQQNDGTVEPPTTLREALDLSEQIKDDDTRKFVQNELRTRYAQEDALIDREYATLIDNIEQYLAVPGNSLADVPPDQFGRLRPVDRQKFLRGQRDQDEMTIMEQVARNPALVAEGDWLERNRSKMTHATFVKLLADRSKPDRILSATIDASEVSRMLFDYGMDSYADPGKDKDAARGSLILRSNIEQRIDAMQREVGRTLRPEEKRGIIREMIVDQAYTAAWGKDPKRPVAVMTQDELGKSYYEVLDEEVPVLQYRAGSEALKKAGIAVPTEAQIVEWWTLKGKPK
jgi:hypothetical protein